MTCPRTEIYCDITTPVRWPSRTEVTMIDLDLDVCRTRRGTVELLDEDEFACHQVRYGYPADVIAQAERSAAWLRAALAQDREPFASVYHSYLRLVTGNGQAGEAAR
jgi:protein associated with RNAse G/E